VVLGKQGDDFIDGNGGADALKGGAGDDTIEVPDLAFFRIDGGGGNDILHLFSDGPINFGDLDANAATSDRGKIAGMEIIDVANGHANALTLSIDDVFDFNVRNIDALGTSFDNVLAIRGDVGDTLALIDPGTDAWQASGGTFSADGVTYQLYSAGPTDAVFVAVDIDISVGLF
jgi:hypothetical protein